MEALLCPENGIFTVSLINHAMAALNGDEVPPAMRIAAEPDRYRVTISNCTPGGPRL